MQERMKSPSTALSDLVGILSDVSTKRDAMPDVTDLI
jgi:hypothetical protein